ncbi:hypothetical protein DCD76_18510 [Acinetobacter baumannii]|nr:hypothetical protein DCD76_18510 [Acinetobacter baumannii]
MRVRLLKTKQSVRRGAAIPPKFTSLSTEQALALLSGIELDGKKILADKAYSFEQIRSFSVEHGAVACIPDKSNFKIKHDFDSELYVIHF